MVLHYFKTFRTILISDKKVYENKTIRNFKRPKILRCSKTTLVSRNKPNVTRKGLETAGIVKTKELEPEGSFKSSCRRLLSHSGLQSS